jgi:hypothetical protein
MNMIWMGVVLTPATLSKLQQAAQQLFPRRPATARIFDHNLLAKSLLIVAGFAHPQAGETEALGGWNVGG